MARAPDDNLFDSLPTKNISKFVKVNPFLANAPKYQSFNLLQPRKC